MRIELIIDKKLMLKAMRTGKYLTKQAAIEAGLQLLIRTHRQADIRRLRGKVRWTGDLEQSRQF